MVLVLQLLLYFSVWRRKRGFQVYIILKISPFNLYFSFLCNNILGGSEAKKASKSPRTQLFFECAKPVISTNRVWLQLRKKVVPTSWLQTFDTVSAYLRNKYLHSKSFLGLAGFYKGQQYLLPVSCLCPFIKREASRRC